MDISRLHVLLTFDPTFDIDVAHLVTGEECIILEDDVVCIPDDATQFKTERSTTIIE
jgi:hypothetical protein